MIRKTISFTQAHSDWMKAQVASGQYASESELIRDLIRNRQEDAKAVTETPEEIAAIRKILEEAEASGFSDRSLEEIREEARAQFLAQSSKKAS